MNRLNPLAAPHKGFRKIWNEVSFKAGSIDAENLEDLASLHKYTHATSLMYTAHNHGESNYLAPKLKEKGETELVEKWLADHDHHLKLLASFPAKVKEIQDEKDLNERRKKLYQFYMEMNKFIAEDLEHMQWEESVIVPTFHNHYTDGEILAIVKEMMSGEQLPVDLMPIISPDFISAMNTFELSLVLMDLENTLKKAPAGTFEKFQEMIIRVVGQKKFDNAQDLVKKMKNQ